MTRIARTALPMLFTLALTGCAQSSFEDFRRALGMIPEAGRSTAAVKHKSKPAATAAVTPAARTVPVAAPATAAPATAAPALPAAPPAQIETGSVTKSDEPIETNDDEEAKRAAAEKTEEGRKWCRQRFIDFQEGKRPGDARNVEQKEDDDHYCEALLNEGN